MLDLMKIIVYTRRIDPNYAKQDTKPGAKVSASGANKVTLTSFP